MSLTFSDVGKIAESAVDEGAISLAFLAYRRLLARSTALAASGAYPSAPISSA